MTSEAIVIGVNNYEFLQPLTCAQQDALAMKTFLEREAGFDRVYYFAEDAPPFNGVSMKPTRNNLRRVMRDTFAKSFMGDGDNFWFFFSGHGMREGERDFLMPIDGDPDDIAESGISTVQISEWLRGCGADNVVMILDACRSGGRKDGKGIGDATREDCRQTGVISLFSCSPNQFSYELPKMGQGAFTKVLLEGLGVQGGCATVARLDEYLKRRVPELVRETVGPGAKQLPYSIAEPINRSHVILMPQHSRPEDLNALKMDAFRAERAGDIRLAYRCWLRVNIASRGLDMEAIAEIAKLYPQVSQRSTSAAESQEVSPSSPSPFSPGRPQGGWGADQSPSPQGEGFRVRVASAEAIDPIIALPTFKFQYATIDQNLKIHKHDGEAHYYRETVNGVDLDLVYLKGGSFEMGSNEYDREKPIHRVTVPDFLIGKYPVTQAQWKAVAKLKQKNQKLEPDPSHFKGDNRPVEKVSWQDAIEFCARLSQHTGKQYRLPSEAEWEYACRAGTTTPFHFGETIDAAIANYCAKDRTINGTNYSGKYGHGRLGQYREETTPVGNFPGNAWGLFDCHGNVWEWCEDDWHDNYQGAPSDGTAWLEGGNTEYKIGRGGSWIFDPVYCRSAYRYCLTRALRNSNCGFRVVVSGVGGSPRSIR